LGRNEVSAAMQATLASRITGTGGRPTGFDYLRLGLALAIVCWHSIVTSYGAAAQMAILSTWARPLVGVLLPAFFTLSGFLVAGSLERSKTMGMFLGLRAIRIFPALAVESLIAALILGPLLTTRTLVVYFSDPQFWSYFLNILGDPHYYLPGVFTSTPFDRVNGQLWTVPFELKCYVTLAVLGLLGATHRRSLLLGVCAGYLVLGAVLATVLHPELLTAPTGIVSGWLLIPSFLAGVILYLYRERVAWRRDWGVGALLAGLALLELPMGENLAILPIAYATVFFGLANPPKTGLLKGADLSYGIFLYGFSVQQTCMLLAPWARHWWWNIALAVPAATVVAALSWYLVEKPALGLRRQFGQLEARWLARPSATSRLAAESR
jgi:peptidoglycan/LPS O-acetylase OafA/YrhL